jgi:REP element-mobilizing transposase RayT
MLEWARVICAGRMCALKSSFACCISTETATIDAFVLMPNHVHAVIRPALGYELSTLLQGIKGVSANRCNQLLGYKSPFWMDESYDHIVRDAKELTAFRNYIARNPAKASLKPDEYSLQLRNVLFP